jgi:hypothetical protein
MPSDVFISELWTLDALVLDLLGFPIRTAFQRFDLHSTSAFSVEKALR